MQTTVTHYENANFLRELAENLPRILPQGNPAQAALLQRLADQELAQAQHDDWVRTKVTSARSDTRPTIPQSEVASRLSARYAWLSNASL